MTTPHSLRLHEQILLLALRDKEGTLASGATYYAFAIAGALLAELHLTQRIRIETDTRKKLVHPANPQRLDDSLLDECLGQIREASRPRGLRHWLARFAHLRHLKQRVAEPLCQRGILRADRKQFLLFFTRKIYPEVNPEPERALIEWLEKAVFHSADPLDPRTTILVSLAHSAGLLKANFDKRRLKENKARLAQLSRGEIFSEATTEAIRVAQAAAAVAACSGVWMV